MIEEEPGADDASIGIEQVVQVTLCVVLRNAADVQVSILDGLAGRTCKGHLQKYQRKEFSYKFYCNIVIKDSGKGTKCKL